MHDTSRGQLDRAAYQLPDSDAAVLALEAVAIV